MRRLLVAAIALTLAALVPGDLRAGPEVDRVLAFYQERLPTLEACLAALSGLRPEDLAPLQAEHGAAFRRFAEERFIDPAAGYASEVAAVRSTLGSFAAAATALPPGPSGPPESTDFVVALYLGARDRARCSGNAVLVLDMQYNADLARDLRDMPRMLEARRLLSEINFALAALRFLPAPPSAMPPPQPPRLIKVAMSAVRALPGWRGRIVRDTLDIVGATGLDASIFLSQALARLADPRTAREIADLEAWLLAARAATLRPGVDRDSLPTVWDGALEVTGSVDRALPLLGIFATQHRTLVKTILAREPDKERQALLTLPLVRCANLFFLVQELAELTRGADGTYRFCFPPGWASPDRRFYHFWSEAFVARSLAARGYEPHQIAFATDNLGRAYETVTLPVNVRAALRMGTPLGPEFVSWREDVAQHVRGGRFALSLPPPTDGQ